MQPAIATFTTTHYEPGIYSRHGLTEAPQTAIMHVRHARRERVANGPSAH